MNFHSDEWIMEQVKRHYDEALTLFPKDRIIGVFLQGSQNYGLDYEGSDIDTKCIVVPTLEDIAMNKSPISTTHVRENNEHIDLKDVRLYFGTFRKQNLNFLEILFTKYRIMNPQYKQWWSKLEDCREVIARYDIQKAINSMYGVAREKYHALEHRYPSKVDLIDLYGYDSKQLHHLIRVADYLKRYIDGEAYESCLIPSPEIADFLITLKREPGHFSLVAAKELADTYIDLIETLRSEGVEKYPKGCDERVDKLLDTIQLAIIKHAIAIELMEDEYYD